MSKEDRVEQAAQAIQDILKQYHCAIIAVPSLTNDGRIVATVQIVARPDI